jgi:putative ABC transport system substrate-binding protein
MVAVNYDPLAQGYIASLAQPGGNLTGVFFLQLEVTAKRLELLKEALPQCTQVAALWDAYTTDQLRVTEMAAQALGLHLHAVELRDPPYDFAGALNIAVREGAHALVVLSSPHFFPQRTQLAALTVQYRLPAIFLFREYVEAGGLMAYGANLTAMFQRAAAYVDRLLQGTKPADLPVEQPVQFEFVINLKTAKALGVALPPSLLLLADEVIQ